MHEYQNQFIEAFKEWDAAKMSEALAAVAELVANEKLSAETRGEMLWDCREILEMTEQHPYFSSPVDVADFECGFQIDLRAEKSAPPAARFSTVSIGLRFLPADARQETGFARLGFGNIKYILRREDLKAPRPLNGEAGFDYDQLPPIHRPERIDNRVDHSYRYALSVERTDGNEWLERYRAGREKEVWNEMTALGARVREPEFLPLAVAVVRETMRRCRTNVERLHAALAAVDYPFVDPDHAWTPPPADAVERIAALEEAVGTLPLSLAAWYELVGAVDFIADPESIWTEDYPDPLYMMDFGYLFNYDEEKWQRHRYILPIAPDDYHKADVSGGPAYEIALPNAAVDAPLENERHETTFVDYLRLVFRDGGFPGGHGREAARLWEQHRPPLLRI